VLLCRVPADVHAGLVLCTSGLASIAKAKNSKKRSDETRFMLDGLSLTGVVEADRSPATTARCRSPTTPETTVERSRPPDRAEPTGALATTVTGHVGFAPGAFRALPRIHETRWVAPWSAGGLITHATAVRGSLDHPPPPTAVP